METSNICSQLLLRYYQDDDEDDDENDNILLQVTPIILQQGNLSFREWYVLPRSSHWRENHYLSEVATFTTSFRMTRDSFFNLHALLQPYIEKKQTHLRPTLRSEHRLAIFLYHIAHGDSYTSLSDQFAVGKSTISNIVGDVSKAIVDQLSQRYIRFPTSDEALRSMDFWKEKNGIPGVVGCIDGCHIPIIQPAHTGTAYCNRKGFYSLNVQGPILPCCLCSLLAAVDHKRRFIELTVGWPGSVADGRVFANSYLQKNLEKLLANLQPTRVPTRLSSTSDDTQHEDVPAFILGDSAYPSRTRIVPTFRNCDCNRSRDVGALNVKLAGIRYYIENAFGILKARFRLLNRALECSREHIIRASYLITAIFVMHNFLIDGGDIYEATRAELEAVGHSPDSINVNGDGDGDGDGRFAGAEDDLENNGGAPTRDILLRHTYWKRSG
jgi:hypothetical protein